MGLFDGTPLERPVTCEACGLSINECTCTEEPAADIEPAKQRLRIRVEKRKRGKVVTVISGFTGNSQQMKKALTDFKDLCGAGGTLDADQIEIQGDHAERLQRELSHRGYRLG